MANQPDAHGIIIVLESSKPESSALSQLDYWIDFCKDRDTTTSSNFYLNTGLFIFMNKKDLLSPSAQVNFTAMLDKCAVELFI